MANINQEVDKLTVDNQSVKEIADSITMDQSSEIIESQADTASLQLDQQDDSVFTGDKVDVAGPGFIKKIVTKLEGGEEKIKQREILNKSVFDKIDPNDGDYIVTPYGPVDAKEVIKKSKDYKGEGKPTRIRDRGKGGPEVTRTNLNNINGPESFTQFINFVGDQAPANLQQMPIKKLAKELSTPTFSAVKDGQPVRAFKSEDEVNAWIKKQKDADMYEVQQNQLYSERFLKDVLDPNKKTIADPVYIRKMLLAQVDVAAKADALAKKILKADADGSLTPSMQIEFEQMFALLGEVNKAIEGRTADVGRSLRMFGEARTMPTSTEQLKFLDANAPNKDTVQRAKQFLALNTIEDKAQASQMRFGKSFSESAEVLIKMWQTTWINGLLSSPITHLKNIVSNTAYAAWQVPVRYTAGGIGMIRKGIFKQDVKTVALEEGHRFAIDYLSSSIDSIRLGVKAFRNNAPLDGKASKLELEGTMNVFDDVSYGDTMFGKAWKKGMSYWGKFVTIPGKALLGEDEIFKGSARFAEFQSLARAAKDDYYDSLVKQGKYTQEQMDAMANQYYMNIVENPPADMIKQAVDFSKELTFTKDLEGKMKWIQDAINDTSLMSAGPLLKMFAPFIRTPTNLVTEALKNSPAMFMNPNFIKAIKAGGKEADMALAKVGLGTTVIMSFAGLAMNGMITGPGPGNKKMLRTYEATGWQKYSFAFNKEGWSDKGIEELKTYGLITQGEGKYYWSFDGLQPLSTLMGIGASIGEYFMANSYANAQGYNNTDIEQKMLMIATMAGYDILSEAPMLQGVADIIELAGHTLSGGLDEAETLRLVKNLSNKLGEFAIQGSPIGVYQSGKATIERFLDPTVSSLLSEDGDNLMDYSIRKYKSRLPYYSDDLPPRLDPLTGEEVTIGMGNFYELYSPFKRSDGTYIPGYQTLIDYNVEVFVPPVKKNGYELTAEQYNMWIDLATEKGKIQKEIDRLGIRYRNTKDLGAVQDKMKNVMAKSYRKAFDKLQKMYPEIADFYDEKDLENKVIGKTRWN